MSATCPSHLTRVATAMLTAATTVALAACGANDQNPGTASTSAPAATTSTTTAAKPPPPPIGHDHIEGLVDSVAGNTIRLTQRNRTAATVDLAPTTMVTELTKAQRPDVTVGSCVDVAVAPAGAAPANTITAQSVVIDPAVDGGCPPPPGPPPSEPGTTTHVFGPVDAVSADTVTVTDPTGKAKATTVTLTDATDYTKHAVTGPEAITAGKCLAAQGTAGGGVLHAATIDLEPCPPLGRPHHHLPFHIPAIPHIPHVPHIPAIPHR